jgi:hypothetical protein
MALINDITVAIQRKLDKAIPQIKLSTAASKAGKKATELWRAQLNSGISGEGSRLRKLSNKYLKFKTRYRKGINHRKSSEGKKWYKDLYDTDSDFVTKGNPNHGRLRGRLFKQMANVKTSAKMNKKGEITFNVKLNLSAKYKRILERLMKKGLNYFMALGSSNRGKKHQEEIKRTFLKEVFPGANLFSGKVTVK